MPDIADIGNDLAQELLDASFEEIRRGPKGECGIGICLNCGVVLTNDGRWCDPECRDDWSRSHPA